VLGQGYLLRPAAVVVTTTATVAPVSAAVGTSSGEQSAVEDFKEMVDNFPPNVLAMLVKLPPVSDDCLDACAQSSCRHPVADGGISVVGCRGPAVVVPGFCLRRRCRPRAAITPFQ
jgi:hypothetical protein